MFRELASIRSITPAYDPAGPGDPRPLADVAKPAGDAAGEETAGPGARRGVSGGEAVGRVALAEFGKPRRVPKQRREQGPEEGPGEQEQRVEATHAGHGLA